MFVGWCVCAEKRLIISDGKRTEQGLCSRLPCPPLSIPWVWSLHTHSHFLSLGFVDMAYLTTMPTVLSCRAELSPPLLLIGMCVYSWDPRLDLPSVRRAHLSACPSHWAQTNVESSRRKTGRWAYICFTLKYNHFMPFRFYWFIKAGIQSNHASSAMHPLKATLRIRGGCICQLNPGLILFVQCSLRYSCMSTITLVS